jgi:hypothetical protein
MNENRGRQSPSSLRDTVRRDRRRAFIVVALPVVISLFIVFAAVAAVFLLGAGMPAERP